MCAIRVSPSCRFTVRVIKSHRAGKGWICLLAYNEHMMSAIPENETSVRELVKPPQSAAQPVGWKSLVELGPREVAISTKCLVDVLTVRPKVSDCRWELRVPMSEDRPC